MFGIYAVTAASQLSMNLSSTRSDTAHGNRVEADHDSYLHQLGHVSMYIGSLTELATSLSTTHSVGAATDIANWREPLPSAPPPSHAPSCSLRCHRSPSFPMCGCGRRSGVSCRCRWWRASGHIPHAAAAAAVAG